MFVLGADVSFSKRCLCIDLLQTNVVRRARTGTYGIPPLTDLIVRWQKLLGEFGTKWPLLFLEPGATEGLWDLVKRVYRNPPSPKSDNLINLLLSYFTYFVFHQGGRRLPKKVFNSTLKVFAFLFLLLLAADWCWVSAGRVEEFSDLLSRKAVAKLCCSFL